MSDFGGGILFGISVNLSPNGFIKLVLGTLVG